MPLYRVRFLKQALRSKEGEEIHFYKDAVPVGFGDHIDSNPTLKSFATPCSQRLVSRSAGEHSTMSTLQLEVCQTFPVGTIFSFFFFFY